MKIWKILYTEAPIKEGFGTHTYREMLVEYGWADAEILDTFCDFSTAEQYFSEYEGSVYDDTIKGYILAQYEIDDDDDPENPETEEFTDIIDISDFNDDCITFNDL